MKKNFLVSTFYKFHSISQERVEQLEQILISTAKEMRVRGLIILGTEGMNSTISGAIEDCQKYMEFLKTLEGFEDLIFKLSYAERPPFRIFKVAVRPEIVSLGDTHIVPASKRSKWHLKPSEWHKVLTTEKDFVLIDTRNWYEWEMGTFKGALTPNIEEFNEFPKWVEEKNIPKDKKILMFCTGGIRCEKAQIAMQKQGYKEVYQLEDGIIKYLEEFPNQEFEGECFVFDHRVAVDQNLEASQKYAQCPHCGQPSDNIITCNRCDSEAKVCVRCLEKEAHFHTCSKNCANHYKMNPNKKGPKQITVRNLMLGI